jgi:hypothetical protein
VKNGTLCIKVLLLFYLTVLTNTAIGQPDNSQRAITIIPVQGIHFGAFSMVGSSGGAISVGSDGSRTSTGGIVLLNISPLPQPAVFEIRLNQNQHAVITFSTIRTLTSKSGTKLRLEIGSADYVSHQALLPINEAGNKTVTVRVGGTLYVPGSSNPGLYHGEIEIGVHQE